ncbi:MAG: translation initiation factor IF-3 [Muribaculaceae bacterium]|nr:translation initiation factor IF-3 [Muribaculaceae bacterium]
MEKKPQFSGPKRPTPPYNNRPGAPEAGDRQKRGNDRNGKDAYRVNEWITAREVRLVGDNVEQGVYPIDKALRIARDQELDLIEISPNAAPPVCRVLDYQKFLYQQRKRQKEQKQKAAKVVVKEIRFGPQTDDHDYNFKLKHAIGFLKEGSKVKAYVFFRGRSILFKEQGEVLLLRFANDLEEYGKVEMMPVLEGKRMTIMISPIKATQKKETPKADKKPKEGPAPRPAAPQVEIADVDPEENDED